MEQELRTQKFFAAINIFQPELFVVIYANNREKRLIEQ